MVWVAKAETEGKGNAWVKIQESGLNGGTWAVTAFRNNAGKIDVTIPDLAAGDYLIRSEIIALHEAKVEGKAQFYNGCGQIKVTSSGTKSITNGVDLKTIYKSTDKGVLFDIYNGASSYPIPGPAVNAGFGAGAAAPTKVATSAAASQPTATKAPVSSAPKPTTLATVAKTTTAGAATPTKEVSGTVAKWGQCGGTGYTGATACVSGATCQKQNPYYSQCL
jgi:cellulase